MKKRKIITLLFITLLSTFSCTNQTVNSSPSNKPSISSTSSPQVSVTPKPDPTPSQDENIISPLPPILAFGNPKHYYETLNGGYYSATSDHIFYMNDKVLKEGITKEAILNKDIVDVTEGTYPEYSPDNKLISFLHRKSDYYTFFSGGSLYVMEAGDITGKTKRVISEDYIYKYDWINNYEILLQSEKELYIVNVNTKEKKLISELSSFLLYDLSPNKKKIVFGRGDIYDLETNTKSDLIDKNSIYYENKVVNPLPIYDFYNSFKWSDNNEDIAFISTSADRVKNNKPTRIVKVSIKTKELVELYNPETDENAFAKRGSIRKIFYYGKDGNLLFFSDVSISGQQDGAGVILALKNTPIDKKSYEIRGTTKKTWISKVKYLNNIYYYDTPPDTLSFIDLEMYFENPKITYKSLPLRYILPYSFLN